MTRVEKIREARRLRAMGWTAPEIGERLGVSDSTIRNWYLGGECPDCGAPIEKSSVQSAPKRCADCGHAATRIWTKESVVDAIQRFARAHGRPPTASEWRSVDTVNGYPATASVYQTISHPTAPFIYWADAIEAAGFPRPPQYLYVRTPESRARSSASQRARYERERQAAA